MNRQFVGNVPALAPDVRAGIDAIVPSHVARGFQI
jgi:hypothetical protein